MNSLSLLLLLFVISSSAVSAQRQPFKTLFAPITKDTSTSLYTITINSHENYVLDLASPFLWYRCPKKHPTVAAASPPCTAARSYLSPLCPSPSNTNKYQCTTTPVNAVANKCYLSDLTYNPLWIYWTNGKNPTKPTQYNQFYASCAPESLFQSLPKGVSGMAGLSSAPLALPTQLTPSYKGVTRKFAMCLPTGANLRGPLFFGDGPYYLRSPKLTDISGGSFLSYTPLRKNPKSPSPEYYIGINRISIEGRPLLIPPYKFQFDTLSRGGGKLSTTVPYTTLRSDIFAPFLREFQRLTRRIPQAKKVKLFDYCLKTSKIGSTQLGLQVPRIDLQLESGKNWTIYGANSMKQVSQDVSCLAFVDGGNKAAQAIVIGSYQMENNFLVFDLAQSRLGISNSLLSIGSTCSAFDFTPKP